MTYAAPDPNLDIFSRIGTERMVRLPAVFMPFGDPRTVWQREQLQLVDGVPTWVPVGW
jgi:hypothetical protein